MLFRILTFCFPVFLASSEIADQSPPPSEIADQKPTPAQKQLQQQMQVQQHIMEQSQRIRGAQNPLPQSGQVQPSDSQQGETRRRYWERQRQLNRNPININNYYYGLPPGYYPPGNYDDYRTDDYRDNRNVNPDVQENPYFYPNYYQNQNSYPY